MTLTPAARKRLRALLARAPAGTRGLSLRDVTGSCRGSVPRFRPVTAPAADEEETVCDGITIYLPAPWRGRLAAATLDYEPSLFGRGLVLTWPHEPGCSCAHRE